GGIAIAIGTMVDIGIVFIENINQHLERAGPNDNRAHAVRRAAAEVAPAVMTSVLTTIVSFLPVFGLSSTELRLFGPLAFTKTFAMAASLLLALLVLPGAALVVLRRRPQAPVSSAGGWSKLRGSLFRTVHLRDWVLLGLGILLLQYSVASGIIVMLMG